MPNLRPAFAFAKGIIVEPCTQLSRGFIHLLTNQSCIGKWCLFSFIDGLELVTVEPLFNEPLHNEVLGITNDILHEPGQSYTKMYGTEPRYNEPRYNEILDTEHNRGPQT